MKDILRIAISGFMILAAGCASTAKHTADAKQDPTPKLKRPEVRKVWVPDQIVGDEYVTGHWKYILQKNAVWVKEDE